MIRIQDLDILCPICGKDVLKVKTSNNHTFYLSKIDKKLLDVNWTVTECGYTFYVRHQIGTIKRKNIYLHREIMQTPVDMEVDHIDGNGLNNCRCNLRNVTRRENSLNKHNTSNNTGIAGIHKCSDNKFVVTFNKSSIVTVSLDEAKLWLDHLKTDYLTLDDLRQITKQRQSRLGKINNCNIAKLNKVIKDYNSGLSISSLARKYGVKRDTIYRWLRKENLSGDQNTGS